MNQSDSFNWREICILIVEDNFITFTLLEMALSQKGIKTIHAENGLRSIEAVRNHPEIDLVLMDIHIPLIDGYESTREIKKMRPDLPVIALTANSLDDDQNEFLNSGCSDYLIKPIELNTLFCAIKKYVNTTDEK
jgi:CheY-like chemotaxis protein